MALKYVPYCFLSNLHLVLIHISHALQVRIQLGLNRCRCVWTAAAPTSMETLRYFQSLNIPLLEIYGMSECTGGGSVSLPISVKTGSVGKPLEGTEISIANQDEDGSGEVSLWSANK